MHAGRQEAVLYLEMLKNMFFAREMFHEIFQYFYSFYWNFSNYFHIHFRIDFCDCPSHCTL